MKVKAAVYRETHKPLSIEDVEVAEPGVSALVYRKNEPAELAAYMANVLDDPALAQRLATAGLATVRARYTLDRILEQTEAAFAEVIAAGPYRP